MRYRMIVVALGLSCVAPQAAFAQDMTGSIIDSYSNNRNAIMSSHISGLSLKETQRRKAAAKQRQGATARDTGGEDCASLNARRTRMNEAEYRAFSRRCHR